MAAREIRNLPAELRELVHGSVAILGEVLRSELGENAYQGIETLRASMAELRGLAADEAYARLRQTLRALETRNSEELLAIAHAFTLMLELMNACENAYRTFRLRSGPKASRPGAGGAIIYVLTSHPTEARSPANIAIFHQIQESLSRALPKGFEEGFEAERPRLTHLLTVAWRLPSTRQRKPRVEDEAEHIYSLLFREGILELLLDASRRGTPVYVRSWVGGDKDGHPGVNELTLQNSWRLSRRLILKWCRLRLAEVHATLKAISETGLKPELQSLEQALRALEAMRPGDGVRIIRFRRALVGVRRAYEARIGVAHPALSDLEEVIRIFPALLVPLELRESSDLLLEAARKAQGRSGRRAGRRAIKKPAIRRMLEALAAISRGGRPEWYARGLIISMASEREHIDAAKRLLNATLGGLRIPIIPLFEQEEALDKAGELARGMLADPAIRKAIPRYWRNFLEIMVGYSDSSKQMGVLPSRLRISRALVELERVCEKAGVQPLFFHGSGGSVDRGGGSFREQTAWWPRSAFRIYKATIQGEMIERSFASIEIVRSQLERILSELNPRLHPYRAPPRIVEELAQRIVESYERKVADPRFLRVVEEATPYRYLSALRFGSRPAKRGGKLASVGSLRAIPWVLCWTQTRTLFPTWWGVGSAWRSLSTSQRRALARAYSESPLFSSYLKLLGFTLAKVELPVWRLYLETSGLPAEESGAVYREFVREYRGAVELVHAISGKRDLLWFRPWLGTSIRLRSPMIHPLNLIQLVATRAGAQDPRLVREAVTGVASGMLTTG